MVDRIFVFYNFYKFRAHLIWNDKKKLLILYFGSYGIDN